MEQASDRIKARRLPLGRRPADRSDLPRPFIKWAGGKSQLLSQLLPLLPDNFAACDTYVEPFIGGGAMLFAVLSRYPNLKRVIINDVNPDLALAYRMVAAHDETLALVLDDLDARYRRIGDRDGRRNFYLERRHKFNISNLSKAERAAVLIFLNHTCFNGLYRVNAQGGFNVPFGNYANPKIYDKDLIAADHKVLAERKVTVSCGDFLKVCSARLGRHAFVYFDPPYQPLEGKPSFTAYAKGGFGETEQRKLYDLCKTLDMKGVKWMQSNSWTPFITELYKGFKLTKVSATRAINSVAAKRGPIAEAVIRNYGNGGTR